MTKLLIKLSAIAALFLLLAGLASAGGHGWYFGHGKIAVADRASGTLSVIDTKSDQLSGTFPLPAGANTPEPMYVVYSPIKKRVFVGDRANNRIVVFDADDFSVETTVPAGAGVFHMWASVKAKQLWVNNDIDNTMTVIHLASLDELATIPLPADLVAQGGKPHDVILDPKRPFAYVSVIGLAGDHDAVVQFSTKTFQELNRADVGKDPHLSLNRWNKILYVPCQETNEVILLNKYNLDFVNSLSVPGAHGACMSRNGLFFYTTNLPGGGDDALYTIFTLTNTLIGAPEDAPYAVPHNIALTPSGRKIYVTHSGANNKVSVYKTKGFFDPTPDYFTEVTVGDNPFGLAFVP
jgi:DNA-binding beta-propeller fold protein YncE